MTRSVFLLFAISLLRAGLALAEEPETMPVSDGTIEAKNFVAADLKASAGGIAWSKEIQKPGSTFLRLHFTDISDSGAVDYTVTGRDSTNAVVFEYKGSAFAAQSELWTPLIPDSYVLVEVNAAAGSSPGVKFTLKDYIYQTDPAAPKSIIDPDQRQQIKEYAPATDVYKAGRSVAKLSFVHNGGSYVCTGFMVSPNLMLTNEHCIGDPATCLTAVALFGYEKPDGLRIERKNQYQCESLVRVNHALDFALIKLHGQPGAPGNWGSVKLDDRLLTAPENLYIIQHPAGEPKQVSRTDCKITTVAGEGRTVGKKTDVGNSCDTLGGSSGSPVFSDALKVIGLHHFGVSASGPWSNQNRAVAMHEIYSQISDLLPQ